MAKTSKKNNDKENTKDNPSLKAYQNMVDGLVGFAQLGAKEKCTAMIPTGHFRLDFALAYGKLPDNIDLNSVKDYDPDKVCGFPLGKVTEIFGVEGGGKTSLAYRIVGYAQKMGYPALWIDAERSFKENLAELNGVDIDTLAYSNLIDQDKGEIIFTAEAVFDNIIKACNAGFKIVVLDSIPALIPKSEMEKDLNDNPEMALLARVLSRSLPKIVNAAHKNDALIILINQIREKPGVMYGCFHADTKISFSDGRRIPIKEVVNSKLEGPVLSYNTKTKTIESNKIVNWFENGSVSDGEWLSIVVNRVGTKNGKLGFTCTPNHILFKDDGTEIAAKDLKENDYLMTYMEKKILLDDYHKEDRKPKICDPILEPYSAKVISIAPAQKRKYRSKIKYDIQVENNSTYLVGGDSGVVVHNSPETRPGGRALKYYASLVLSVKKSYGGSGARLLVRTDENGVEEVIGGYSEVKIEKTRLAPPLLDKNGKKIPIEFPVYYKPYFPDIAEQIFDVGRSLKLISVRKGVYTWRDTKIEGKAEFITEIKEKSLLSELANEIETKAEESNYLLPPELTQALMGGDLELDQEEPFKVKEQEDDTSSSTGTDREDTGMSEDS